MLWLVIGYLFLFIVRPYEYWPILGAFHVERIYMLILITAVAMWSKKRYIPHGVNRSVLFFFSVLVLSSLAALSFDDAYDRAFDYFKLIVFYFIIILTIRDEKDLKNFMIAYIAIMLIYIGKSSWEFFINDRYVWRMGIKRMTGMDLTYNDPNAFAASIVYSLPYLWAMFKYKFEDKRVKWLLLAYAILATVCVIYTGSRSGMVTALLFFFLVWLGTSRKFIGVIVVTTLLAVAWVAMPPSYQHRFMSIFHTDLSEADEMSSTDLSAASSAQGRIYTMKMGYEMFKQYPLLGVGPGNFRNGLARLGDHSGLSAHNLYGLLLGETGLIGALAFVILLGSIIACHRKVKKTAARMDEKFLLLLSIASIQAVILLLFNGNFGGNLYRYNWLWIGAIGVLSYRFLVEKQRATVTVKPGQEPVTLENSHA